MPHRKSLPLLIADDDEDDRERVRRALAAQRLGNELRFVGDGEELLDYLYLRGRYADPASAPRPGLILLDLNMPRLDGREALRCIKSDPSLRRIPVIILTTPTQEEDVLNSYRLGANCFISKPVTFEGLVELMEVLVRHWLQLVELPGPATPHGY